VNVDSSELRLVESAAAGDREARRGLFELHRDVAYRVALRITGRNEDAMDVVQESFIKAFDGLAGFQRDAGFRTWLLRIVSNRSLDLLRARRVRLARSIESGSDDDRGGFELPAAEDSVSAGLERSELAERLKRAVDSLPADQRSVFAMYSSGDMTYGEIAEALGIPIGTVMSRLYHARRRLHEVLADLAPPGAKGGDR